MTDTWSSSGSPKDRRMGPKLRRGIGLSLLLICAFSARKTSVGVFLMKCLVHVTRLRARTVGICLLWGTSAKTVSGKVGPLTILVESWEDSREIVGEGGGREPDDALMMEIIGIASWTCV